MIQTIQRLQEVLRRAGLAHRWAMPEREHAEILSLTKPMLEAAKTYGLIDYDCFLTSEGLRAARLGIRPGYMAPLFESIEANRTR